MRIVIIGAGEIAVTTAELLIEEGNEVVMVEADQETIDSLSDKLDCSFLKGDGSDPEILREVAPKQTDVLLCLTDDDKTNILASLLGRSLEIKRVITRIHDPKYEGICNELGLNDSVVPARTISRFLRDMLKGNGLADITTFIKNDARLFLIDLKEEDAGKVGDLDLPKESRVICCYRDGGFFFPEEGKELKAGDEVVVLTDKKHLSDLEQKWKGKAAEPSEEESGEEKDTDKEKKEKGDDRKQKSSGKGKSRSGKTKAKSKSRSSKSKRS